MIGVDISLVGLLTVCTNMAQSCATADSVNGAISAQHASLINESVVQVDLFVDNQVSR